MLVLKKINNNVVLVRDHGVEKMAMGNGIGFAAKVDEKFDDSNVEKIFILDSQEKILRFSEMANEIPLEYLEFTEEIISFISSKIKTQLDSNIYIALTDHIYFAIQREKENLQLTAIMLPEMKLFYPDEYDAATDVVAMINKRYQTQLGINEIGFITMHIINAELGEENSLNSLKILEITSFIIQLIEDEYEIKLDKASLTYNRLLIHIKFLVKRLIYQENIEIDEISFVKNTFKKTKNYKKSVLFTKSLKEKYQLDVNENEIVYLAIHLSRL